MPEKLIELKHHVDDYECMWNGIEDIYMSHSGEILPDFCFFSLSGAGNFVSYKSPKSSIKRHAMWSDGRTKKMYERLAPLVGFHYKRTDGTSFSYMLSKAKNRIDAGECVVLGCLDMYCLSYYPKFYHRMHIPIHYVLMTGYSDEKQCVYILDCGMDEIQELGYTELEEALNVKISGLSGKNGLCEVHFDERVPELKEIAGKAFREKARSMINPPAGFVGISGMRRLAREFPDWRNELSEADLRAVLIEIITFTGTVPVLPDAMLSSEEKNGVLHRGQREKLSRVLRELSERYKISGWESSAQEFDKSGELLEQMTDAMTDYLMDNKPTLDAVPALISDIADTEERAFSSMLSGAQEIL